MFALLGKLTKMALPTVEGFAPEGQGLLLPPDQF